MFDFKLLFELIVLLLFKELLLKGGFFISFSLFISIYSFFDMLLILLMDAFSDVILFSSFMFFFFELYFFLYSL